MASPFTVFRRNQKVLLAVTGILAMIAFVFLGTCVQSPGPVQAYQNPTVVSWKYGEITEAEMAERISMRRILNHFIRSAITASGRPVNPAETYFPETEDSVVRSMVLARRGRELGLVISDDMVNRVLAQLTSNRVSPAELEQIIANTRLDGGQRLTAKQMFDALREELLARHAAMLFLDGLGAEGQDGVPPLDTPAQRWDHFRRLERQTTVQVLPVPVAEFTEEVGKPSDEDLRALFEKYKDQFPAPSSPEPGFRQPYRARFEYFKADSEELVTAEMKNVSAEAVREYYEKNKDTQFRKSTLSPIEPDATKEDAKDDAAKDEAARGDTAKDDAAKDTAEDNATKSDAAKEATDDGVKEGADKVKKPDAQPPDDGKKEDTKSGGDAKSEPVPDDADAKPGDAKSPTDSPESTKQGEKSAQARHRSSFRLVNFQEDKAESKAAPVPTDEGKDAAKSETEPDTKETEAKSAVESKTDAANSDAATVDAAKTDPAPPVPVEYRPLEQVEEEIRRTLARERVQKIVEERFSEVRSEMNRYAKLRMRYQRESAKNPDEPKPKPLDLQGLADKYHLKLLTTDFISRIDAAGSPDLEIARSFDFTAGSPGRPFAEWTSLAFEKGSLSRPRTSDSLEGHRFLWWKIDEKQGQVPSFNEARDEVLQAWKRIQAREIGKRQAEQYAKTVRQAKQPMKEVFAQDKDLPVTEAGPFSWLTRPNVPVSMMQQPPQIQYPDVPGVLNAGEEFMETTFGLEAGEVGVAFNHPKSIVYVIQPASFSPSDSVLEQEFMVRMRDYDRYRAAGSVAFARAQENWMDSLFEEYGVQWHRMADLGAATFE